MLAQGYWNELPTVSKNSLPPLGQSTDIVRWRSRALQANPLLLAVDTQNRGPVVIKPIGGPALPQHTFAASLPSDAPLTAETPGWLDGAVGLVHNNESLHWCAHYDDSKTCRLTAYGSNAVPLQSRMLADDSGPEERRELRTPSVPMAVRGPSVYVGLGSRLYACEPHAATPEVYQFSSTICGVAASPVFTRQRLAVSLSQGAALIWDGFSGGADSFAEDLPSPLLLFLRGGWLVAVGGHECHVYQSRNGHLELYAQQELAAPAFAILPMPQPNDFAIGTTNGTLTICTVGAASKP